MASNEETNAAGTDTRPPMLIWKSTKLTYTSPKSPDPPPTDSAAVPCTEKKLILNSREEENKLRWLILKLKSFSSSHPKHDLQQPQSNKQLQMRLG
ncbi:hypothetical protein Tco_1104606 [Tanacetum coccineum]